MIEFPETAQSEWDAVANAATATEDLRKKIEHDTRVERETELVRIRYEARQKHQQEIDADQTPELEMATLSQYRKNPAAAPADLIDGVLKDNGLCIMLGPNRSGKTTKALQMWHSLSSGEEWLGQQVTKLDGALGVVSYDMDAPMMFDWMSGYPGIDTDKVSIVNAYKRGNPLGVPAMRAQIAQAWKDLGVEVVIIDSFSASFFGENQNDAATVMHHYRDLILFALTECGARALVVIAHSTDNNPTKARGSTVHHDVADSIVAVEILQGGPRRLSMAKYRAARGQKQMEPVIVGAPDDQTHLVALDPGAMTLAGLPLPASAQAAAFTALPDPNDDPDVDDDDEDDDL